MVTRIISIKPKLVLDVPVMEGCMWYRLEKVLRAFITWTSYYSICHELRAFITWTSYYSICHELRKCTYKL